MNQVVRIINSEKVKTERNVAVNSYFSLLISLIYMRTIGTLNFPKKERILPNKLHTYFTDKQKMSHYLFYSLISICKF